MLPVTTANRFIKAAQSYAQLCVPQSLCLQTREFDLLFAAPDVSSGWACLACMATAPNSASAVGLSNKLVCAQVKMFHDLSLGWQDPNTLTHRERLSMACELNIDIFALTQEVSDNLSDRDR